MIIGIDYRLAHQKNIRGMGKYVHDLVQALNDYDISRGDRTYILYTDEEIDMHEFRLNFINHVLDSSNYLMFEQVYLPKAALTDHVDVLWCPYNTFPLFLDKKIKLVVTIHDLLFMDFKYYLHEHNIKHFLSALYRNLVFHFISHKANSILVDSKFIQNELKSRFKLPSFIISPKLEYFVKKLNSLDDSIFNKFEFAKDSYIFTISGTSSNKNLLQLIHLFIRYNFHIKLVIAGVNKIPKKIKNLLEIFNIKNIYFLPPISEDELISLYKNAKSILSMSTYEGFGMPILESLPFNSITFASDILPFKEILSDGGIYFNPLNIDEIHFILKYSSSINKTSFSKYKRSQLNKYYSYEENVKNLLLIFNQ